MGNFALEVAVQKDTEYKSHRSPSLLKAEAQKTKDWF